jgi:hypothetical protein
MAEIRKELYGYRGDPDWISITSTPMGGQPKRQSAESAVSPTMIAASRNRTENSALAKKRHPPGVQQVSPNSPKGMFILSGGFSNGSVHFRPAHLAGIGFKLHHVVDEPDADEAKVEDALSY